jgi:hypothetical protein
MSYTVYTPPTSISTVTFIYSPPLSSVDTNKHVGSDGMDLQTSMEIFDDGARCMVCLSSEASIING